MASQSPKSKSRKHSSSREILELMRECEAREWMDRYHRKVKEVGVNLARSWWGKVLYDIRRIRGDEAVLDLKQRMNRIKNETRSKS